MNTITKLAAAALAALAIGAATVPAAAGEITGNMMYSSCQQKNGMPDRVTCLGYIRGAADAVMSLHDLNPGAIPVCMTGNETGEQLADVVVKFLRENPVERAANGGLIVTMALHEAWPCKKGGKSESRF
jgi:hypothetical protein